MEISDRHVKRQLFAPPAGRRTSPGCATPTSAARVPAAAGPATHLAERAREIDFYLALASEDAVATAEGLAGGLPAPVAQQVRAALATRPSRINATGAEQQRFYRAIEAARTALEEADLQRPTALTDVSDADVFFTTPPGRRSGGADGIATGDGGLAATAPGGAV